MDHQSGIAGSVKRARQRAMAGLPREGTAIRPVSPLEDEEDEDVGESLPPRTVQAGRIAVVGPSRIPRPKVEPPSISRPTPVPQWPLRGPSPPKASEFELPASGSEPPRRPPRPSQVPSILDSSRVQDPIPSVFPAKQQSTRESNNDLLSVPSGPQSPSSRPSTLSSVGTIPDFPVPVNAPVGPPRRSVNLGPPPSARRGASSFYSNASYVSPIPEESPRSRSHGSYASSAAMPDGWATDSPAYSPGDPETFFDERIRDSSRYSDSEFGDESQLVRSASVGKRGVPALVNTPSQARRSSIQRPSPSPLQREPPFSGGTAYLEASSSSSGALPTARAQHGGEPSADNMLSAFEGASGSDPAKARKLAASPKPFSRLSAIRRPPRLDIDAVREAEARGSLTSLPDLIKRATRLAAMIERGRRPASRFDIDDFPEDMYGRNSTYEPEKGPSGDEKHQSGLSDMLAAFPPPAQAVTSNRRSTFRQSLRQSSSTAWPLPFTRSQNASQEAVPRATSFIANPDENGASEANMAVGADEPPSDSKRQQDGKRRCCGLPLWGFITVIVIVVVLIAAAVIIPLQFFVFRNNGDGDAQPALTECQNQLVCQNGGTNVISQGVCSCICTNGFTGSDCSVPGSEACTTVAINSTDSTALSNVTLGQAIPRLIEAAQTNFSIPLSATTILAKLNTDSLSCASQNALVTFDGEAFRGSDLDVGSDSINLSDADDNGDDDGGIVINQLVTLTIQPGGSSTVTISIATGMGFSTVVTAPTRSEVYATTLTLSTIVNSRTPVITTTATATSTAATSTATPTPSASFTVSDDAVDFARVAVLFILQQESLNDASAAQNDLQRFFSAAENTNSGGATIAEAMNVTVGNDNTVDLVNFQVDVGNGPTGGRSGS